MSSNRIALAPRSGASLNILPVRSPLVKRANTATPTNRPESLPLTPRGHDDIDVASSTPTKKNYSFLGNTYNVSGHSQVVYNQTQQPEVQHQHQQIYQIQQSVYNQQKHFQTTSFDGSRIMKNNSSGTNSPSQISVFKDQRLTPNLTISLPSNLLVASQKERDQDLKDKSQQASLAATKLKLKLLLAIYRLKRNGKFKSSKQYEKGENINSNDTILLGTCLDLTLNKASMNISKIARTSTSTSPSFNRQLKKKIGGGANLKNKIKTKPSLSYTALKKNREMHQEKTKFKLYAIKKSSKFYSNHKPAPLTQFDIRLPKIGTTPTRQLPSINKILKTPMKLLSRNLINPYLPQVAIMEARRQQQQEHLRKNALYTDDTIDEDEDGPLKESTIIHTTENIDHNERTHNTIQSKTLNENNNNINNNITNNTTNNFSNGMENEMYRSRSGNREPLSSSPIRGNSFGTPNLFSVAKSLLQLGTGFY